LAVNNTEEFRHGSKELKQAIARGRLTEPTDLTIPAKTVQTKNKDLYLSELIGKASLFVTNERFSD
jgi:hypothetical protein